MHRPGAVPPMTPPSSTPAWSAPGNSAAQLEILDGAFAGQTVTGVNMLNGSLEQDKLFSPGDRALVVVSHDGDTITNVTMSDHYRLGWEALLAAGLCPVSHSLCRAHRGAGHRLLCADRARPVEGAGPPLSQGVEPHLGRAGHHSVSDRDDHCPGVRL